MNNQPRLKGYLDHEDSRNPTQESLGYSPQYYPGQKKSSKALVSLVLGLVGIVAWFIPLFGFPVCITGLVFGILGLKSEKRGIAIAGIILSGLFLLATLANFIAGFLMALQWMQDLGI